MKRKVYASLASLILVFIFVFSIGPIFAANIYVSPIGSGPGTKQSPTSLETALDTANNTSGNHVLLLQQGMYDASAVGGFQIEAVGPTVEKTIRLSGGWDTSYSRQSTDPVNTVLDGNDTTRVLNLAVKGGTAAINYYLERLTIENGYIFGDNGAGIKVSNDATDGGYINVYILACLIRNNHARKNASNQGGNGGGLFSYGYVEVKNTTFEGNSSDYHGAAINFNFRTPYTRSLSPKVNYCKFLNNYNVGPGSPGGSAIINFVSLIVTNSYFEGQSGSGSPINSSYGDLIVERSTFYNNSTLYWGGAVQYWDSNGEVKNCLFVNNNAGASGGYGSGGAITIYDNTPDTPKNVTVTNCTFKGNSVIGASDPFAGAIFNRVQTLNVINSIFWNNGWRPLLNSDSGTAMISYSDIEFGVAGTFFTDSGNNINLNPEFVAVDNYRLQATSPCVDTGNNTAVTTGTDIEGNLRFYDGKNDGTVQIDMGAYELSPDVTISPVSFDFGEVTVGTTSPEQPFTVYNTSSLPLVITGAATTGIYFGFDLSLPGTLNPNTSTDFLVGTFSPKTAGARNAIQKLYSTDPDTPICEVSVTGMGVLSSYPKVTLLNPNGGEKIQSGSLYPVRWGAPGTAASFKVRYSLDNGLTWKNPPNNIIDGDTSYLWEVPVLTKNTKKCLLSVTGYTGPGGTGTKVGSDKSDMPFTIEVVRLVTPNGKETLRWNTLHDIVWETGGTMGTAGTVQLFYTRDGGGKWTEILVPPTFTGNLGRYTWAVPSKKGTQCKVKVVLKDSKGKTLGSDISDTFFTLKP
jgi:hypothetical protein